MKIASFNVNSLRARVPVVLKWISEHQPDILCLQETKCQDDCFPADAFAGTGYKYVLKGEKSYNGVAIFSKSEIQKIQFGFDDEPKDPARFIKAQINGINVVNTYVPQGESPQSERFVYKLKWFERLYDFFNTHFKKTDPIIWVGDLNIAPEPIDLYDPETLLGHVCYHPAVHEKLKKIMDWGFVDVFRMHCKEAGQYTYWDYRFRGSFKRNIGWRLDHIIASKPLAEKSTACYIDVTPRISDKPSDHTPIVAEFDWR